ncbi:DedA family protein [Phaeovulum vinaykumarii]|uniref:Membrane protein DedA, SNARE-associated domain n=1 Tax=Phaeovulum vinaykumarii TaxID=407234 RepID=A0A1N7JZ95_9RHOB|nr:VTT domain-containing protein [Phaeovulum vinaykumarii]SIS54652.1 membrane protein DedA, SNARE-associated domain [Phaeovulum vinaykumarii]SOB92018.1 membrane protein DedA with SNARE-associated domain [Phaeovulum vinaykumarii]
MIGLETLAGLVQAHGASVLAPLAVIEGPIVTVIAAHMAALGHIELWVVVVVVVLADLVGDAGLYALGRGGPGLLHGRWRERIIGANAQRLETLTAHFSERGGRTLVMGKLTHSAGALVLLAAGAARMPFLPFLWFNFLGTLPKSLFFAGVGYTLGQAYSRIDDWLFVVSTGFLVLIAVAVLSLWLRRKGFRT